MSYHIYELVEGPDYPALKKRQRCLAWASARAHLRRAALDVPDVICVYGADVSEDALESAVEKETGLKTPWLRFTLDEFVERLKRDMVTYHDEAPAEAPAAPAEAPTAADVTMAPEEAPAAADVTMAPADVVMAPAEAPADEISQAQEFLRERFAAAKLAAAPARRGRPKAPLVCAGCKLEFHSSDAKYNHVRRGKCIPV
jgi:hypothetical protein